MVAAGAGSAVQPARIRTASAAIPAAARGRECMRERCPNPVNGGSPSRERQHSGCGARPRLDAMAHLLGAENLALEYPTKVVFERRHARHRRGRPDRRRRPQRRRQVDAAPAARRAPRARLRAGHPPRRRDDRHARPGRRASRGTDRRAGRRRRSRRARVGRRRRRCATSSRDSSATSRWDARLEDLSAASAAGSRSPRVLIGDWDVVFLDEPTNHLDVEGIAWLAGHLKKRWPANPGGLVVVTHDRWFLDEVCTDTWEVHDRIVEPFEGGYAAYVLQRVERDRQAAASESKRQNLMRKELAWLRRGAPARTTKPKFRIDAANELIANEPPVRDTRRALAARGHRASARTSSTCSTSRSRSTTARVLHDIEWRIAPGERTGILGRQRRRQVDPARPRRRHASRRPPAGSSAARPCASRSSTSGSSELDEYRRRAGQRRVVAQQKSSFVERRRRADARPAARAARLHERAALDAGQGPLAAARSGACSCC